MNGLMRGIACAAVITAAVVVVQPPTPVSTPAPASASASTSTSSPAADYQQAESTVDNALWQVMGTSATDCWEQPQNRFGRTPHSAVVKRDGTTLVYQTGIDIKSDEWVLAWCEVPVTNKETN